MTPVPAKQSSLLRRSLLAGAGGLLAAPPIVRAQGANGVALVVGNAKYKWEASLPNVGRDAPDVAKRFQAMGLRTELIQDADRNAMLAAIDKFKSAVSGANLAAFYFAGHGVSWDKQTYVVPVDADLSDPKTAKSLLTVPSINVAMQGAAHRLLIFDSCRNSPADGWRQREAKALARNDAEDKVAIELSTPNTLALFSTASGAIALDGPPGANSPFAAALLRQLGAPSVDLQALPARLRRDLLLATECRQMVSDRSTYSAPFVITVPGKPSADAMERPDPSRIVELSNAYAFAQQNGLVLPSGLVACRPVAGTADARMIGAYKHEFEIEVGNTGSTLLAPALFIVLSIPTGNSAELVASIKSWSNGIGSRWRVVTANRTESRVTYLNAQENLDLEFTWRDQNSGRFFVSGRSTSAHGKSLRSTVKPFTRLDG